MRDIVFKDHMGERPLEDSDFLEVLHPDIGNIAKKISQMFPESQGKCWKGYL